jgi:hypothetical protein
MNGSFHSGRGKFEISKSEYARMEKRGVLGGGYRTHKKDLLL